MQKEKYNGIRQLLEFAGSARPLLAVARILSGISSAVMLVPFLCIYFAARELLTTISGGTVNTSALVRWGVIALVFTLAGLAVYFVALLLSHRTAFRTEKNLKMAVLKHLAQMPLGYFEENPSGKLRKIIDENSAQTQTFLAHQLPDLTGAYVTMLCSLALLLTFDWRIGVLLLLLFALSFALQFSTMNAKNMERMRAYQDAMEGMNHEAVEYVRGIAVVKVFGQTVKSFRRFNAAIEKYRDNIIAYTMGCRGGMIGFITVVNSSFFVLVPSALILGATSHGIMAFFQDFLFYVIFTPACAVMLNKIMYMSSYKMEAQEAMRRINTILSSPVQPEPGQPQKPKNHNIGFEDVSFTYTGAARPAVTHLNFIVSSGKFTALVGHSGSGKTTAASLIPRFYDVQQGRVTIGGTDVHEIAHADLMSQVAFVFQDPKLFKDSLLENIRAARPAAAREEVLRAAHLAQCDDILAKLPKGIDTVVGTKGVYLSGGETQRIAIARAILKDAPIIVLDEATAFADPENEYEIHKAFEGLTEGKTVLMIAHRLSTVQKANQILVFQEGGIVEKGTHTELLSQKGIYAGMWEKYLQTTQWHIGKEAAKC